ncbi:MAG: MATE family efflux transporter [Clostridiales bacterium]|jgi:putative MATE family efflux protein|nr:MATE family efflux transporter [Clostridiales bacterium]
MQLDMTRGRILPTLLRFIAPLIIGNLFQQVYNLTDMYIAGRFIGANAVAAVGSVGALMFLLLGFMMGLTSGCTVLTAQRFGAGDAEGVKKSVAGTAIISVAMAIAGTLAGLILLDGALKLMNMSADIYDDGKAYIQIIYLGLAGNMLYNSVSSLLRAAGDSKASLYFLLLSAGLNVVLDILLIAVIPMGVKGAAIATIISQTVSGAASLIYMVKKVPALRVSRAEFKIDWGVIMAQLKMGLPMALQFTITAMGIVAIQSALNTFGTDPVAGYAVAVKVDQFVQQPIFALSMAMTTFAAQNKGRELYGRIKKGTLLMIGLAILYCSFSAALSRTIMRSAVRFIISGESAQRIEAIASYAQIYANNTLTFIVALALLMLARNVLQGCGYSFFPMIGAVLELGARFYFSARAAVQGDFGGVCFAQPITWSIVGAILWAVFIIIYCRKMKGKEFASIKREEGLCQY